MNETDHVTQEAEEHRGEVDKTKTEAKNSLKNHCITMRSTSSIVEQPVERETVEAKQYPQDAQERADLTNQREVPAIRSVQKTVQVPRVQYIDKVADIPVDVQRQGSTIQAAQHINEVEDVPALTQSEVPNIPDDDKADEDLLEHENKKRPAEAVSESRADESDFDRFDDLVLPRGRTRKTAGDGPKSRPGRKVHAGGRDRRARPRT